MCMSLIVPRHDENACSTPQTYRINTEILTQHICVQILTKLSAFGNIYEALLAPKVLCTWKRIFKGIPAVFYEAEAGADHGSAVMSPKWVKIRKCRPHVYPETPPNSPGTPQNGHFLGRVCINPFQSLVWGVVPPKMGLLPSIQHRKYSTYHYHRYWVCYMYKHCGYRYRKSFIATRGSLGAYCILCMCWSQ